MAAITAQDLANFVLQYLREDSGVNFGGLPNVAAGAPNSFVNLLAQLNVALTTFISRTGYAPSLTEIQLLTAVTDTSTTNGDYALPTGCKSLARIEYQSGSTGFFTPLPQLSFDRFDAETGLQYPNGVIGMPDVYREPFAGKIRFNPQPGPAEVTAGDMLMIYYTSDSVALVNPTDTPNIPDQYHEALYAFVLSRLWLVKNDLTYAKYWDDVWKEHITDARKLYFNLNKGMTMGFQDDDETLDGIPDSDLFN
jgi:hypothetical protein